MRCVLAATASNGHASDLSCFVLAGPGAPVVVRWLVPVESLLACVHSAKLYRRHDPVPVALSHPLLSALVCPWLRISPVSILPPMARPVPASAKRALPSRDSPLGPGMVRQPAHPSQSSAHAPHQARIEFRLSGPDGLSRAARSPEISTRRLLGTARLRRRRTSSGFWLLALDSSCSLPKCCRAAVQPSAPDSCELAPSRPRSSKQPAAAKARGVRAHRQRESEPWACRPRKEAIPVGLQRGLCAPRLSRQPS